MQMPVYDLMTIVPELYRRREGRGEEGALFESLCLTRFTVTTYLPVFNEIAI